MGDSRESGAVVLREVPLGAAIVNGADCDHLCQTAYKFYQEGGDFGLRDSLTEETFVHLVVSRPGIYSRSDRVGFLYLLCCKPVQLDATDSTGHTALHHAVRHRGAHRMIACLMRCGADPLVENGEGKTAEQILRTEQPDGWEENLHWLQKFLPGLFRAVLTDEPDMQLVERLLRSWCRLCKVMDGQVRWLKCCAHKRACSLRIVMLLEKYENTIELALASLAGKTAIIQNWRKEDIMKNMDVNTCDSSYQYGYPDYPSTPRPLLAAVWETNNYDMVDELMKMQPDLALPFRFEPEAHHHAKPLFFYLIDPKMGPADERIVRRVLQDSDLTARNTEGQTILFEAVQHSVPLSLFTFILQLGCPVSARDRYGRTVRDYSQQTERDQYVSLVDQQVEGLVAAGNIQQLEQLILLGYDHVTDLDIVRKHRQTEAKSRKSCKQLDELLNDASKKQDHVRKMFESVKSGGTMCVKKLITKKYVTAQDRGGRTVLHHALQQGNRKLVESIVNDFPQIINIPNNMGQTPLHYAYLFQYTDNTVPFLLNKGACADMKDVEGWMPSDYVRETIGSHAHELMQQRVRDLELDLFLSVTNFDVAFLQAIRNGDRKHVEALAIRLRDHGGMKRFKTALFECLDTDNHDIACTLIKLGFSTEVYKQYEMCEPDDPMCAMMECSHTMTSFTQRARQVNASKVLQLMDDIASGKVRVKGRNCCMGRCLRPTLPPSSTAT